MIEEKLLNFLCTRIAWEDLGNENLLHEFPEFGKEVGASINGGTLIEFTKELSAALENMDLYKASLLSNFIGFACEKENDTSAGPGIVKLFVRSCTNVYDMFQSAEAAGESVNPDSMKDICGKNPDWAGAYYGFNVLCISVMAFITRDVSLRNQLAQAGIGKQIRYLAEETPESPYLKSIYYVDRMQDTCSDLKLLVLYPEKRKGFLASANDLNNCFHLLFLLEEQIYKKLGAEYGMKAFYAEEPLIRLAHGEYPDGCWEESYVTYFMECNYGTALHEQFGNDDAMSLIWGEMPPFAIPQVDGRGVIVLFGSGINRSFSPQFLAVPHNALRPYVEIEGELTDKQYDTWMSRIRDEL